MGMVIHGVLMAALAILGLFLASGARDATMHGAGLLLFLFGVVNIFVLIHRLTEPPRSAH